MTHEVTSSFTHSNNHSTSNTGKVFIKALKEVTLYALDIFFSFSD